MRAAVLTAHGDYDVIQTVDDLPIPDPGPEEVRVRMKAAALNRLDLFVRRGWKGLELDFPHVIGSDGAGVIDAVGENVHGLATGDPVSINPGVLPVGENLDSPFENQTRHLAIMGEHTPGLAAEYRVVPARNCVKMPTDFSFAEAAAAGLVYVTAWHSLMRRGELRAGESVLIVGASGGVNSASIQLAALAGANPVYVVGSNAEKCALATDLGADVTINREETPDWSREIYKLTDKRGVDVVVDNVGEATMPSSLRCVRPGGRILVVGGTSGYNAQINIAQIFARHISILGSSMGEQRDYADVMRLVFAGKLRAVVGAKFSLDEARQAQETLETFAAPGKIVIAIDE